jgi:putative ABC transport system substrate-binding protein
MRRREFITLLGGAAVAMPLAARAQQRSGKIYTIGFLTAAAGPNPLQREFVAALAALGYREGRNVVIEPRYGSGDLGRLTDLARDLVTINVDVIVTEATPAAAAARQITTRVPIVMATSGDPVASGLIASLARPGGNITGMATLSPELDRKRIELLRELMPGVRRVAFFGNNQNSGEQIGFRGMSAAAAEKGIDAAFIHAPQPGAFQAAFATILSMGADAMIVTPTPTNIEARKQIIEGAARHRLLVVYGTREFVDAGGLASYGTNRLALSVRAASFVDRILKGANPAELPVEQPTKFDLLLNMATAKALGLTVPPTLLARADEVIE